MTSQRIFITGVTASLMKGLLDRLLEDGHQLVGLSRQKVDNCDFKMIQGDLRNPESWKHEVQNSDMVIHAAATTHSHQESEYFRINLDSTRILLEHCRADQGFVYISSRTAGPKSGGYGRSKWEAEEYIRSHHRHHLILSPSEVFGVEKGEGIEKLIHEALNKRIIFFPGGVQYPMCPIHVDDLCREMHRLITGSGWPEEPIIINGVESMDFRRFFDIIAEASDHHPLHIPIPAFLMRMFGKLAKWAPGILPFTSDQVARLFAPKKVQEVRGDFTLLREYVKGLNARG